MRASTFLVLLLALPLAAQEPPKFPGPTKEGFLLPNGWHLTPVGKHLVTTDLPLNILPLADNKHVLVASSGFNAHDLMVVDITGEPKLVAKMTQRQSWYGLATDPAQKKVWWSGGGQNSLHVFDLAGDKLTRVTKADPNISK